MASLYRPTVENHEASDKLLLCVYKKTAGLSRYAKTQPIWAPQKDSGMGLMRAATRYAVAVQREWIRHYGGCRPYFREGLIEYIRVIHKTYGPRQKSIHVWLCLQQVVTQVDLPMWLPGTCTKKRHILVRHKDNAHEMAGPVELS